MNRTIYVVVLWLLSSSVYAEPCLKVTLTGTQGGTPVFQGQAGSGTLVQYGDAETNCSNVNLQFDSGRGTTQALSKVGMQVADLDAVFLTHLHSDHTEGLIDMMQLRWHFASTGPKVDLVCSEDAQSPAGFTLSCSSLAAHLGDALINSGEIAQRLLENDKRLPGGPTDLINVVTFKGEKKPNEIWSSGQVTVSAVGSTHIPGHASYRVDTPAGSVVIGGDAGNDVTKPPRSSSTSEQVETLAQGADIIVHSTIHPVMSPDNGSGLPPAAYYRQSTTTDLGAMAKRTGSKHLMLTHLVPSLGAPNQGPFKIPGGALSESDYEAAVSEGGFTGNIIVGTDLTSLQLPE